MKIASGQLLRVGSSKAKRALENAKAAQRQGRWSEAYAAYQQALPTDERRFGILVQMGHMSKEMGLFQQAEAHYMEALTLKPRDWDLHVQLGHLFNRSGDLSQAKYWYAKASEIQDTAEVSELLHSIKDLSSHENIREMRQQTLEQMDTRRFAEALPNVLALYKIYGLRDFDVIAGHAYRELGQYAEARDMYQKYFERCLESRSRQTSDACWHLMNILEILDQRAEVIEVFARLKKHYSDLGQLADFGSEQAALLESHIGKMYAVLRR